MNACEPARLDVRPYHERGEEPFAAIMEAFAALAPGQALLLVNSFDPVPLVRVMDRRGFDAERSETRPGEWHVLFTPRCSQA